MRLGTAMAMAALLVAGSAAAADLPPYYAPPAEAAGGRPLEFGAGWYLRGDAAFSLEDRPKLQLGSVPAFDRRGTGAGFAFGAGAGYQFTDWLRVDVTGDYRDPFHYGATTPCGAGCVLAQRADVQRIDGLVNGYVDLGTWAGFTPYVGAGAGVATTVADGSVRMNGGPLAAGIPDPRSNTLVTSRVPTRTDFRFAWAAMAGVSYAVAPRTLLDVGYRYVDLGRTTLSLFPAASVTRGLSAQELRVGLRYMVD